MQRFRSLVIGSPLMGQSRPVFMNSAAIDALQIVEDVDKWERCSYI